MAIRMLSTAGAIAIALSGCAGAPPITPGAQIASVCGTAPGYITSTQIVCGSEPPPHMAAPVQAAVPPPALPPVPVRSVAIEYVEGSPMVRIGMANASFRCILDTGASDLVIPLWWLKDMHANYGFQATDFTVLGGGQAQLAGGGVINTAAVRFAAVSIGPWKLTNVPGTIVPDGICLIGMSVLKAFGHPMIDFANQRLVLED